MGDFLENLMDNQFVLIFSITTILDIFLGSIRAFKERKWNSTVGINGALRKVAMIGSLFFLAIMDSFLKINFLGFIPKEFASYFPKIGLMGIFTILFVLYEFTSILKNMVLCGLPVPKKLENKVRELLKSFTTELEDK